MSFALPLVKVKPNKTDKNIKRKSTTNIISDFSFTPIAVDLNSFPLSNSVKKKIIFGEGVTDRSAVMFGIVQAMLKAKMTEQEILSVLTDQNYFLGEASLERSRGNREKAAKWVLNYTLNPAREVMAPENVFGSFIDSTKMRVDSLQNNQKLNLIFENFKEIDLDTSSNPLVEDYLDQESICLVFGNSNSGKTFFSLDLALRIAVGMNWNDRKVQKGAVLYVAAEGGRRIRERVLAFKNEHNLNSTNVPFRLARGAINLFNSPSECHLLIDEIIKTEKQFGMPIKLIVLDTLNRVFSGGNENASEDIGSFIKNVDTIRIETKATVLIVHHSGKSKEKGARGHSALRGAVDTEIHIEEKGNKNSKTNPIKVAQVTKQRDYDYGDNIYFKLKPVNLGLRQNSKIIQSCVVVPEKNVTVDIKKSDKPNLEGRPNEALKLLKDLLQKNSVIPPKNLNFKKGQNIVLFDDWRKICIEVLLNNLKRSSRYEAFQKIVESLKAHNLIFERHGYVGTNE